MFDISISDRFLVLRSSDPGEFLVVAMDTSKITLQRYPEGEVIPKDVNSFAVEYSEGHIVRTARAGEKLNPLTARHLLALFMPEGRQVTVGELADWQKQRDEITAAATKQFYANKFIDQLGFNRDFNKTEDDLADFISRCGPEARFRGLGEWVPSATTIRNLVRDRVRHVSLVDCLRQEPAVRKRGIWPDWTYALASEAIEKVFRKEVADKGEAYAWFFGQFFLERDEGVGIPPGKRPTPPTERVFRNWFKQESTPKALERAHGSRKSNRIFKGTITPQEAIRPLQIVIIDQTLGNIWSAIKRRSDDLVNRALPRSATTDEPSTAKEGTEILASKRVEVVYAVDVFSRKTLALILTFEPPSIRTFMACLKMIMTPKVQWQRRFPDLPDATDGYGTPETVVVDNLRVHITDSVVLALLALNIGIEYAPLASPEWKAIVERAIGTVKRVMAKLPGGFSIDDDANPADYQKRALLDLEEIDEFVTHKLITEHHTRVHRGTGEPPGLRWLNGIKKHGRNTVCDIGQLDLMLRRRKKAVLTRAGVQFKGHRYHNETQVTRLLAEFSAKARGGEGDPVSLVITVLWKPDDCSSIGVLGPGGKVLVELPNADPLFVKTPVSFEFAAAAKKANDKIFDENYPPEKRARYLRDYFEQLERLLPRQTHKVGKKTARLLEGGRAVVIAPDIRQYDVLIPVTNLGVSSVDIPISFAADDGREMPTTPKKKGPPAKPKTPAAKHTSPPSDDRASYLSLAMSEAESEAYLDQLESELRSASYH